MFELQPQLPAGHDNVLIVGAVGSGTSVAMRHFARTALSDERANLLWVRLNGTEVHATPIRAVTADPSTQPDRVFFNDAHQALMSESLDSLLADPNVRVVASVHRVPVDHLGFFPHRVLMGRSPVEAKQLLFGATDIPDPERRGGGWTNWSGAIQIPQEGRTARE